MTTLQQLRQMNPRILCLGSHPDIIQSMLDYEYLCGKDKPSVVAIVTDMSKQERYFWGESEIIIPVVQSLGRLSQQQLTSVNVVLNTQSARRVLSGSKEMLEHLPSLQLVTIFAEKVPEQHALELAKLAHERGVLITGPASVGFLLPGVLKLCAIGGTRWPQLVRAGILSGGDTAVISTSGGMVNELIHGVTHSGLGVSFACALGGERYPTTTPAEAFLLAQEDPQTKRIVYFGELGGGDEYEIAELLSSGRVTKQVIAYIAGTVSELFETPPQFGHAKAMAKHSDESAAAKKSALHQAGAVVLHSISELGGQLSQYHSYYVSHAPVRSIGARHKRLIMSTVSGDIDGDVQLLGQDLLTTVQSNSLASLTLSMLVGSPVTSERLISFSDFVLRLLVDHGPYVSGAVNTIVTARAGRDLTASLASGLLTIGPRFGGAINEAARTWLDGVHSGQTAKDCVQIFSARHEPIPGIGHKKYRIDLPDPRVAALLMHSSLSAEHSRHLAFAQGVEAITTAKKGNLILNVDGTIAAILLDLLQAELGYSYDKLHELVDIGFFNAFFVISRSIGFTSHYLDQRRHDEGLVRFSEEEIAYIPPSNNHPERNQ